MTTAEHILALKPRSIFDVVPEAIFIERDHPDHAPYIRSDNYYEIKYAIAKFLQPRSILEVGVRYGYSLCSLIAGAGAVERITAIDNASYKSDWSDKTKAALSHLSQKSYHSQWIEQDAATIEAFTPHDLAHIDGPHNYTDTLKILRLCRAPAILIDDMNNCPDDFKATETFIEENRERIKEVIDLPSTRGERLILFA